eukprot:scaffold182631_cov20-Cyclotella_meneghiniana.AAC.1
MADGCKSLDGKGDRSHGFSKDPTQNTPRRKSEKIRWRVSLPLCLRLVFLLLFLVGFQNAVEKQ